MKGVETKARPNSRPSSQTMKTLVRSLVFSVVLLGAQLSGIAAPVVLDFETKPDGTAAAHGDRLLAYSSLGIAFVNPLEVVRCAAGGGGNACPAARSGSNMVRPILNTEFRRHLIDVRFAAGQDTVTGYVRYDGFAPDGAAVHAVMNIFDETDAFLGSATVNFTHNNTAPGWNTITKSAPLPIFGHPFKQIYRIEIWGGLSSPNLPPTWDTAENFLQLDDLTFEPMAVPGDTTPPQLTVFWPTSGSVHTSALVESRVWARDETRLQSVDVRAVHESGAVVLAYSGGTICGGPGMDACPEREFGDAGSGRIFEVPLSESLPGNYTITFRARDAAGNSTERSRSIVLDIPGPIAPGTFSPAEGFPTVLRHTADGSVFPGTEVTLTGNNFHDRMTVFLYDCPEVPPLSDCREDEDYFEMEIVAGSLQVNRLGGLPDEVRVIVPHLPEIIDGKPYSIVIRDGWFREGVTPETRWRLFGPPGNFFRIRPPEYPRMHGFNFVNDGGPGGRRMFTAVFGRDAFARLNPCRMKMAYVFYYRAIFRRVVRESGGSCVGMASTSRRFANEILRPSDFEAPYPFALPGGPVDPSIHSFFPSPPRPAEFRRDGLCGPWLPRNLWAVIRRNHGAQFSHQFFDEILDQLPDRRLPRNSNPVAALNRVRESPTGYVICMRREGGNGHCVTPYGVVDGMRFAWGGTEPLGATAGVLVADPDVTAIHVYDNNNPGDTNRWINVNRVTNTFEYRWLPGESRFKYQGKGLLTVPIDLWDRDLTRPTLWRDGVFWLMHFILGDADVMHETADGRRWGWDSDGAFVEDYAGGYDIPGFHGDEIDLRDNAFFTAPADAPSRSLINVRGPDYYFHADQGTTVLQLHVADGAAGDQDRVDTRRDGNRLASMEYFPASARAAMTPTVVMEFNNNEVGSFAWSGLNLLKGESAAFEALPGSKAVQFTNNSPRPARYTLKVDSEDDGAGFYQTRYFGPIDLPAGAAQKLVLHGWPVLDEVRSELDVDKDGVADHVAIIQGNPSPDPMNTFMGVPYTPLGNALVQKDNQGNLRVGGLLDEDEGDGIAFHFGGANRVQVEYGTGVYATETPTGAVQGIAVHSVAGTTLAILESGDAGDHFRYLIDFGRIGSETAEVRMSYKGAPVLHLTGHSGPVTGSAGIGGSLTAEILANGQLAIGISWNQPALLGTGNANPVLADSIMWISEGPNSVVKLDSLDQLIVAGYLVPPMTITGVSGEPFVLPPLDSSREGDNLTVFWKQEDGLQLMGSQDLANWEQLPNTRIENNIEWYETSINDKHPRRFFKLRSIAE
jgi:hypothetical protein